jgi:hypothetical protein
MIDQDHGTSKISLVVADVDGTLVTAAKSGPSSSVFRHADRAAPRTGPVFAGISRETGKVCKNKDWLAGAGGFEPRHFGIVSLFER